MMQYIYDLPWIICTWLFLAAFSYASILLHTIKLPKLYRSKWIVFLFAFNTIFSSYLLFSILTPSTDILFRWYIADVWKYSRDVLIKPFGTIVVAAIAKTLINFENTEKADKWKDPY